MSSTGKKNILLLHLESVSRANLWQYRNELGTAWRLMSSSLQFTRFFTTSTSTIMSVHDLMHGDASLKDACPTFQAGKFYIDPGKIFPLKKYLGEKGYRYMHFATSPYMAKTEVVRPDMVSINDPYVPAVCEKALTYMARAKQEKRPFFAYFWDDSSHLAYVSPQKDAMPTITEKLRAGYALVDASVNRLLSGMAQLDLWKDTIIIGFGDHGDEPWGHGLNRGYCHSLSPYASVCWTPMFIYDQGRFEGGLCNDLASMIDIKYTVWKLLFPEEPPLEKSTPFTGIDLFSEKRKFVFSQNMFALQREMSDPEKGMLKGYAVTDGNYRLVATSGGDQPERSGLRLYCDRVDPANSLNLLKFFKMDRHGAIQRFVAPPEAVGRHFAGVFGTSQVESLIAAFDRLKPVLLQSVKEREKKALCEYAIIAESSDMELARWLVGRYAQIGILGLKPEDYLPLVAEVKNLFAQAQPQTFPDDIFTMAAKAP